MPKVISRLSIGQPLNQAIVVLGDMAWRVTVLALEVWLRVPVEPFLISCLHEVRVRAFAFIPTCPL